MSPARLGRLLAWVGLLAAAAFLAVAGLNLSDEVWALQVALRVAGGETLYRDVFFGATPLSAWLTAGAVALFGGDVGVPKTLAVLAFAGTAWIAVRLVRRLGGAASARWAIPAALLVGAPPTLTGLYSPLAMFLLFVAFERALAAGATPRPHCAALWAGLAAGASFAAKQNTGLLALGLVLAWLAASTPGAGRVRLRVTAAALAGFVAVTVAMLVPIAASGALGAFVDQAFLNKRTYLAVGAVSYRDGLRELERLPGAVWYLQALLLAPAALVVLAAGLARTAREDRRPVLAAGALLLVTLVAGAFPRADYPHIVSALPAVLAALAVGLPRAAGGARRARVAGAVLVGAWLAVALVAQLSAPVRRIAAGDLRPTGLPHLRAALMRPTQAANIKRNAGQLSALAAGEPVFVLAADAALYYVTSGVRNPTRFDYPLVTAFGRSGEQEVVDRLQRGEIRAVCLGMSPDLPLRPPRLYDYVTDHMTPRPRIQGCRLYVARPEVP